MAGSGLVLFNVAVVRGVAHAEPAVIGITVASVPLLLAVFGPLLSRSRPAPLAIMKLQGDDAAAAVHLAVVVTAAAFVLWYSAVARIGPGRAGLFTCVVPIVAAAGGMLLGGPTPTPVVWPASLW